MLIADSKFWVAASNPPPVTGPWPASVIAQPILINSTALNPAGVGAQFAAGTTCIDIYRHGVYPRVNGVYYDTYGGKIVYNILYCDGHVTTQNDGKEAYRSIRMKFPK